VGSLAPQRGGWYTGKRAVQLSFLEGGGHAFVARHPWSGGSSTAGDFSWSRSSSGSYCPWLTRHQRRSTRRPPGWPDRNWPPAAAALDDHGMMDQPLPVTGLPVGLHARDDDTLNQGLLAPVPATSPAIWIPRPVELVTALKGLSPNDRRSDDHGQPGERHWRAGHGCNEFVFNLIFEARRSHHPAA